MITYSYLSQFKQLRKNRHIDQVKHSESVSDKVILRVDIIWKSAVDDSWLRMAVQAMGRAIYIQRRYIPITQKEKYDILKIKPAQLAKDRSFMPVCFRKSRVCLNSSIKIINCLTITFHLDTTRNSFKQLRNITRFAICTLYITYVKTHKAPAYYQ